MSNDFSHVISEGISKAVTVELARGATIPILDRPSAGLIVATRGQVSYVLDGRSYLSDEGHALLLSPGITYRLTSLTDSASVVINFDIRGELPFRGIQSYELDLSGMARRIENTWTFQKPSYQLQCIRALYDFFIKINRNTGPYFPSEKFKRIEPSIGYLESHYTDPDLSNDELAAVSGVSTVYFRKLFLLLYGVPPMKYIRQKRIEKAKSLLETRYYTSISDVAEASGFHSIYYFSRAFRQETDCSPSEYMVLYSNKSDVGWPERK